MRILVVEDDVLLGKGVVAGLSQAGFAVDWCKDGDDADAALSTMAYDAVVLDIGLPKTDGLTLLKRLRSARDATPVLILTARDAIDDRIAGLDAGSDDYLVKPFDLGELLARLRALVRRSKGVVETVLSHGPLTMRQASREVMLDGNPVTVSEREYALLQELLLNVGRVLSKPDLEDRIYGWGEEVESNTIEVYVHRLRRKLHPDLIRTVRGVGYVMPNPET
jgi:DNA-binding response OmpR family regulator